MPLPGRAGLRFVPGQWGAPRLLALPEPEHPNAATASPRVVIRRPAARAGRQRRDAGEDDDDDDRHW